MKFSGLYVKMFQQLQRRHTDSVVLAVFVNPDHPDVPIVVGIVFDDLGHGLQELGLDELGARRFVHVHVHCN